MRCLTGKVVQARGIRLHERGHLVDEGACTARTGAVHALLDAVVEVDDLRVLAAQLDGTVRLGDEGLDGPLGGDDLLHELEVEPLGEQHAARARDRDAHRRVTYDSLRAGEELPRCGTDVGVMALVVGVDQPAACVDDGELDRGGAHVNAKAQIHVGEVDAVCGIELRPKLPELDGLRRHNLSLG